MSSSTKVSAVELLKHASGGATIAMIKDKIDNEKDETKLEELKKQMLAAVAAEAEKSAPAKAE